MCLLYCSNVLLAGFIQCTHLLLCALNVMCAHSPLVWRLVVCLFYFEGVLNMKMGFEHLRPLLQHKQQCCGSHVDVRLCLLQL